MYTESIL